MNNRRPKGFVLSRRAALRGLGVSLALPWLEAMQPRRANAAGTTPLRFLTVTVPHGIHMPAWTPKQSGVGYTLPPILQPLASLQADFNVISGLANYPASITSKEFAGSHARATGAMLTQSPLRFTSKQDIQNGISVDQMIANQIKDQTRLPSLEIGVSSGSATGNCEDGYSCAYLHNIAWNGPSTFMPKETNPKALFERMFSGGITAPTMGGSGGSTSSTKETTYRKAILDLVHGEADRLNRSLGASDRAKMDEYLTSVGEMQRRVADFASGGATASSISCMPGAAPDETPPQDYQAYLRLLSDLLVMAFQCDVTRVSTFMMEDPFNSRSFAFLGVAGNHHELSHHGGDPAKQAALQTIDTFEATQFAYFIGKLKAVKEGDQDSLYNSVVLFTSEFGDGDDHYHWDLPMLVAGHAGGKFATGRHISYAEKATDSPANKVDKPMANLFLSVMQAFGMEATTFGTDGTQPYGTAALSELAG